MIFSLVRSACALGSPDWSINYWVYCSPIRATSTPPPPLTLMDYSGRKTPKTTRPTSLSVQPKYLPIREHSVSFLAYLGSAISIACTYGCLPEDFTFDFNLKFDFRIPDQRPLEAGMEKYLHSSRVICGFKRVLGIIKNDNDLIIKIR